MKVSCEAGHERREMFWQPVVAEFQCMCGERIDPHAVKRTIAEQVPPGHKAAFDLGVHSLADFDLEVVINKGGSRSVEYPRPSQGET